MDSGASPDLHFKQRMETVMSIQRALVIGAGTRPRMASIEEQTWESFSTPWNVDVKIAFEVGRAALARPLRPDSTVVIVSSGAGLNGSPLSGGYAGAKRMQMFLASYLQRESDARGLGIRFVALAPRQLLVGTAIGVARAILSIASGEERRETPLLGLTGGGLEAIA